MKNDRQLGHGVRMAFSSDDDRVTVTSKWLPLGWSVRRGMVPGTALAIGDELYEVVRLDAVAEGDRWELHRWPEREVARIVVTVDEAWIAARAAEIDDLRRGSRRRFLAWPWLMVLGLAPAVLQRRWSDDWGYPAASASRWSAVAEMVFGAFATSQLILASFGREALLPSVIRMAGPLLVIEGLIRLAMVAADDLPHGSVLTLPIRWVIGRDPVQPTGVVPSIRSCDADSGELVVATTEMRNDWDYDGQLQYRGEWYRLRSSGQEGRAWVYRFGRETATDTLPERTLTLRPPALPTDSARDDQGALPGLFSGAIMSALLCLGPARHQRRWADRFGFNPIWFTIVGTAAELIGGGLNLGQTHAAPATLVSLVNVVVVLDGLARLLLMALHKGPVGSILGWPLGPLFDRWLPPSSRALDSPDEGSDRVTR